MVDPNRVKKLLESSKLKAREVYNYPKPATRPAQNIDKGYTNPIPAQNVNPKSKNILDKFPEEKEKLKKLNEDKRRESIKKKKEKEKKRREAANKKAKYSGKNVNIPKVGGQYNKPFGGVRRRKRKVRERGMFDI